MEGVQTHADVEAIFATGLHHILVGADTSGFQSCKEKAHAITGTAVAMGTAHMSGQYTSFCDISNLIFSENLTGLLLVF